MSIKNFLLEKVSKYEIEEALRNPNVRIGAEFEFKIPKFLEKYKDSIGKFEKLNNMAEEYFEYDDALDEWADDPNNTPIPKLPEWAKDEFEPGEEIPHPEDMFPFLKVNQKKLFSNLIKDFLPLDKLPFTNYIVSDDNTKKSSTQWVIKPDGSLGLSGIEIVSPILGIQEFLNITPKLFTLIDSIGTIENDCGFHISISLNNVKNLGASLDITKLSLFTDEGYIYKFFDTREFNTYAKSAHTSVTVSTIKNISPVLAEKLIDEDDLEREYPNSHYMAINIEHLKSNNEYIEFRYLGGINYHRKWDRIKTITAQYIHNLSIACDPSFKRKEYEKKLSRLLNKIQLFTVSVEMSKMVKEIDFNKPLPKKWKDLWNIWNSLYIYKKSIDEDLKGSSARKGFDTLCNSLDIDKNELIWDFSKYKH